MHGSSSRPLTDAPRAGRDGHGLPPCYACGSAVTFRQVGINEMYVCTSCGMGRLTAERLLQDYWAPHDPTRQVEDGYWQARRGLFNAALRRLEAEGGRGRVLDLGGGVGYFAQCALELGWDAYSLDRSELAVQAAAARLGDERSMPASAAQRFAGTCDVVTLWCVIAHVDDPLGLLGEAMDLLKPGGRLLITTPNFLFQAPYTRVAARLGRAFDFVKHDHLLHFTPAALEMLLRRAGLESWRFEYLGVTAACVLEQRLSWLLIPFKRAWNWLSLRTTLVGLPPLCAELQVIAVKPAEAVSGH